MIVYHHDRYRRSARFSDGRRAKILYTSGVRRAGGDRDARQSQSRYRPNATRRARLADSVPFFFLSFSSLVRFRFFPVVVRSSPTIVFAAHVSAERACLRSSPYLIAHTSDARAPTTATFFDRKPTVLWPVQVNNYGSSSQFSNNSRSRTSPTAAFPSSNKYGGIVHYNFFFTPVTRLNVNSVICFNYNSFVVNDTRADRFPYKRCGMRIFNFDIIGSGCCPQRLLYVIQQLITLYIYDGDYDKLECVYRKKKYIITQRKELFGGLVFIGVVRDIIAPTLEP